MAYERYISRKNKLYIVLRRLHSCETINGKMVFYPTTVELLDVAAESAREVNHADFETMVSDGVLKRVQTT